MAGAHAKTDDENVRWAVRQQGEWQMRHHFRNRRQRGNAHAVHQQSPCEASTGSYHGGSAVTQHFTRMKLIFERLREKQDADRTQDEQTTSRGLPGPCSVLAR